MRADEALTVKVREAFTHARRPKDELELATMRRAAVATAAGYAQAAALIAPGVTERAVQIELEAEFFRQGAHAHRLWHHRRLRAEQRRAPFRADRPGRAGRANSC